MNEYQEKLASLGFTAKPKTSKTTPVHDPETGKYGGFHTERGKPGTGVSEGVDATVQGGRMIPNPGLRINGKRLQDIAKER